MAFYQRNFVASPARCCHSTAGRRYTGADRYSWHLHRLQGWLPVAVSGKAVDDARNCDIQFAGYAIVIRVLLLLDIARNHILRVAHVMGVPKAERRSQEEIPKRLSSAGYSLEEGEYL